MGREVVGNESSVIGQRPDGRYRDLQDAYARRWKPFFDAHKGKVVISAIAAAGLLVACFLIVSSKGNGMNPILPVGLGFFAAYIAIRRKDD